MKLFSKITGLMVVLGLVVVAVSGAVAQDSTVDRAALIQKISGFLQDEAVVKKFAEKGVDTSKMISKLDSLSDAQLVKLAEQAPTNLGQVGGALDDDGTSAFWKTYGLYMLFVFGFTLVLIAAA